MTKLSSVMTLFSSDDEVNFQRNLHINFVNIDDDDDDEFVLYDKEETLDPPSRILLYY